MISLIVGVAAVLFVDKVVGHYEAEIFAIGAVFGIMLMMFEAIMIERRQVK